MKGLSASPHDYSQYTFPFYFGEPGQRFLIKSEKVQKTK